jgi:monoamine oxidase
MAGLAVARLLAEAGRGVTVLEAAPRVGGRIYTVRDGNEVTELGAEFLHGKPPELWALVKEAGLETYELAGSDFCFEDGRLESCKEDAPSELLDQLKNYSGLDQTLAAYLEQYPLPEEQRQSAINFVEGFNAADQRIISVAALGQQRAAEEAVESDRLFRIPAGYDRLPNFLAEKVAAAGGSIVTGTCAQRIEWTRHRVRVFANHNGQARIFDAAQAVVTLPLGVLQRRAVMIDPAPDALSQADRLRMGQVRRFTLLFHEPFWQTLPSNSVPKSIKELRLLFSFASMPPVWWTRHPLRSNAFTGWVGGPRFEALASMTPDQLAAHACEELAKIFSQSSEAIRSRLAACHTHDWRQDPLSFGAYSYVSAGALDACAKMTLPCDDTLFFAGEHTDTTAQWGTVHAAVRSGQRAARQMLER